MTFFFNDGRESPKSTLRAGELQWQAEFYPLSGGGKGVASPALSPENLQL